MGLHLSAYLGLVLPIGCIDSLGELAKLGKGQQLPNAGDLILDAIRKAIIEVVPEGTFFISSDLQSNPIELNDILCNLLTILHGEVIKLLGISNRVMQSKVDPELEDKLFEVVHTQGMEEWILHEKKVQLEPFKGHTLQVQLYEGNFCMVSTESLGAVLKVQLALH